MNRCFNSIYKYLNLSFFVTEELVAVCFALMYISCKINISEGALFTSAFNNEVEFSNVTENTKYESNVKNLMLKGAAKTVGLDLRLLVDKELGIQMVQDIFNSIKTQHSLINIEEKNLKKLSKKIEKKVGSVLSALNETISMIINYANQGESKVHFDCSGIFTNEESSGCETASNSSVNVTTSCPILNISEVFQMHRENNPSIKTEYFLPAGDDYRTCMSETIFRVCMSIHNEYCQPLNDPYFEQIYLKSLDHNPRQIVLIIDHGSSNGRNQLSVAKSLSKYIVTSLGHGDQICVIGLSETAISLCIDGFSCENNKHHLLNFIDSLNKSKGSTNHSLGFELAFDLIKNSMQNNSVEVFTSILYVSKGLLSSITEGKTVLEVIAAGQKTVFPRVIINTCALIDEWKSVIYEKHFLRDIAQQNYYKYNISFDEPVMTGVMEEISVGTNSVIHTTLGPVVRRLMGSMHIDDHINDRINFFLPQLDEVRAHPVITISKVAQVRYSGIIGVASIQVFLEDIVEDIIYYSYNKGNSYAFLINTEGYILMHPSLKQVIYYVEQPWAIDISLLEIVENISAVRTSLLKKDSGEIVAKRKNDGKLVEYSWQKVENAPYVVVVVSDLSNPKPHPVPGHSDHITTQIDVCTNDCNLVYNRLDYLVSGQYSLCRHMGDLTTLDAGSLFLSASCFQSPFKYLLSDKNASYFNIHNYMAYIKDKTKLLANPGLKTGIRSEIISLSTILPLWKKQFFNSRFSKYIVRRYIATKSGIKIMYPGTQLHHRFDPEHSTWYTSAVNNPSRLMLTAPYPDTGDAGYIVTLSQAFVSTSTGTTIVIAMDVTYGYLQVMLMDVLPYCSTERCDNGNIKCFIMDDRGYLLSHPSLSGPGSIDANGKPPLEGQHITYKESLVANDILNHKGVVEKLICFDLSSGTVQRYYKFNMSVNSVISNIISGDQCVQYQLVAVPSTNIFIGVVNTTCDINTAFCPCSRIDRHCLNCDRMEQTACECPCECPMNSDCNTPKQNNNNFVSPCSNNFESSVSQCSVAQTLPFHVHQNVHQSLVSKVKSCSLHECHNFLTYRSCLGVVGCEWCQYKSDGVTQLVSPFCTVQPLCFNGVLGSNIPFGEGAIHGSTVKDGSGLHNKSSSAGAIPMGGAVIAVLFSLVLMCYCYNKRSQSQLTRHDHNYIRPVSLFALEKNNNNRIIEEPPTEPHNGLLESGQEVSVALLTPVSPYLMNTGYCRPPTGDSDHGYSTMTPHEDTDHVEVEPAVPVQQTLLSHHILAPVTVHMVMDT